MAAFNFAFTGPLLVGLPYLSDTRFQGGAAAFGIVISAYGAGALGGAVLAGSLRHVPRLGLITLVTTNLEGHSSYRTIEDLQANLDRDMFWRVHRSFLVNINRIKEVVPWFKSSYQLRMDDRKHTEVPVSRVQTRRLRELFKL